MYRMNLQECIKQYKSGSYTRNEYLEKMMEIHKVLLQYPYLLGDNSQVKKIEIVEDDVLLHVLTGFGEKEVKVAITSDTDAYSTILALLNLGEVEKKELDMVNRLTDCMGNVKCFLDIGANEGWYSLNMKNKYPALNCYCFEPIPATYQRLKHNFEINGYETDNIFNMGLGAEEKKTKFYYNKVEAGASSMRKLRDHAEIEEIECLIGRLDDFVEKNNITQIDFVKCDVEGSELFVFQGGLNTLREYKPIILCEMLRKWAARFDYHPNDIIKLFKKNGYKCYVIAAERLSEIHKVTEETVETNYFFLHEEKHQKVISSICD